MKSPDKKNHELFTSAYKEAFEKKKPNWRMAFANWKEAAEKGHLRS